MFVGLRGSSHLFMSRWRCLENCSSLQCRCYMTHRSGVEKPGSWTTSWSTNISSSGKKFPRSDTAHLPHLDTSSFTHSLPPPPSLLHTNTHFLLPLHYLLLFTVTHTLFSECVSHQQGWPRDSGLYSVCEGFFLCVWLCVCVCQRSEACVCLPQGAQGRTTTESVGW